MTPKGIYQIHNTRFIPPWVGNAGGRLERNKCSVPHLRDFFLSRRWETTISQMIRLFSFIAGSDSRWPTRVNEPARSYAARADPEKVCPLECGARLPLPYGRVNFSIVVSGYSISGFAVAPTRNEKEKNREIPLFWLLRQRQIRWHD
jgi:hypothetical protein